MLNAFAIGSLPSSGLHGKLKAFKSEQDVKMPSDKDVSQLEYERSLMEHQLKIARKQVEALQVQLAEAKASANGGNGGNLGNLDSFPSNIQDHHTSGMSGSFLVTHHSSSTSNLTGLTPQNSRAHGSQPMPLQHRPSYTGSDHISNSHGNNLVGSLHTPVGSFSNVSTFGSMSSLPGGTYLGVGPGGTTPTVSQPSLRSPPPSINQQLTSPYAMHASRQSFPPPNFSSRSFPSIPALHSHFNYGIPQPGEDLAMFSEPTDDLPERSDIDALDAYASELGLDSVTEAGQVETLQAEVDRLTSKLQMEDAGKLDLQKRVRELEDENSGLRRQVAVMKGKLKEAQEE